MNKMMTRLLLAAACLVASPLLAQSTTQGAIDGTIFDSTDAVVSKAAVTIHNNGTNAEIHLAADESGYFKAPLLEPGTYTVTIVASGFRDYRANNVIVQVSQITTLTPHLATGVGQSGRRSYRGRPRPELRLARLLFQSQSRRRSATSPSTTAAGPRSP